MSDLIERQAVIDALEKWFNGVFGIKESDGTATIFKRIRELPTAEPKKGKWIDALEDDPCYYRCSECGRLSDFLENFCPNCGADMRGEE